MAIWNFYHSGILYGKIEYREGVLQHRPLDPKTACLEKWQDLTDGGLYRTLSGRDFSRIMAKLKEYQRLIREKDGAENFQTPDGELFMRREGKDGRLSYIQRNIKFPKDLFLKDGNVIAVQMAGRDYCSVLVLEGMEEETILSQWKKVYPETRWERSIDPELPTKEEGINLNSQLKISGAEDEIRVPVYPVSFTGTYMVETRDGEKLATDVYLPGGYLKAGNLEDEKRRYPTVLIRTPYGKGVGYQQYYRFVQRGYGVVIQDVRGREDSTGEWLPNYYEVEDGDDTLNWIAAQDWSDGQVAMTGGSYLGYVQWAAAASGNTHLKAMLSSVCAGAAFVDVPRRGGCFNSGMLAWAFAMTNQRMRADLMVRDDWEEVLNIRPLKDLAKKALGHDVPFLTKWLDHMDCDEMWKRSSWKERNKGYEVPALIMSGWFDDNGMGTTEALELVEKYYSPGKAKVVMGPWMHSGNANYDIHGIYMGENAIRYDIDIMCFEWLEHFLNQADNGIEESAPVEYYTLGDGKWKTATAWPIPEARELRFYLSGGENEAAETGLLVMEKPEKAGEDSYDYNPENPSFHIVDMSENELEVPEDYTEEEKRGDVLCYSTPVLQEDITVTGDVLAELFVSSDCPDTDFMVRLTDVDEKGKSIKLADGCISAKYRNGFDIPEFMEPGGVYRIPIRTTKISNNFKKGHRIRFTVTSSAKNFIFPNSNTRQGFDSQVNQIAHNTIHLGREYASSIRLRVERRQAGNPC